MLTTNQIGLINQIETNLANNLESCELFLIFILNKWDMQTMVENYLDLTVEEVYDVITNINVWPKDFTKEMKISFINRMIKHFEEREEYEKCAKLHAMVQGLENNKSSIGRGRIEPN